MNAVKRARRVHAFTLLELLVVIGIIAVLVAILLPLSQGIGYKSKSHLCMFRLRTVGQMLEAYQKDNGGRVFPVTRDAAGVVGLGLNVPPHERWPMLLFKVDGAPLPPKYDVAGYDMSKANDPQYDAKPYTPGMLLCPLDLDAAQAHSYVLNIHLADETMNPGGTMNGVPTSEIILAGEKRTAASDYYLSSGDFARTAEPFRHGPKIGSNYLFLDGHVANAMPDDARRAIDPWDAAPQ
jgi:prepilin-type processing-associated H-X9-DG protein/prepilin-type N-terminal cleavage/methylation domain-containing protein